MNAATALTVVVPFLWLGMVLAISFLEAPVKFRAPGITVELGVGIGRLVFRALNSVELVLAVALTVALVVAGSLEGVPVASVVLVIAAWVVLLAQVAVLRPLMDRKVRAGSTSPSMPRTRLHFGYIGLELAKVGVLVALGVVALVNVG